jgi:hypothetical protein
LLFNLIEDGFTLILGHPDKWAILSIYIQNQQRENEKGADYFYPVLHPTIDHLTIDHLTIDHLFFL